jgi:uncharacterized protein YdhG (YjbR/CyaY superfamily)
MAMHNKVVIKNVDDYIKQFPENVQASLQKLRNTIKIAAPKADEVISYMMPAYKYNGILVYFAGYKNHIGFYAAPTGHKTFKKDLAIYKSGKGSVQFPLDKPLPLLLISKIVKYRVAENLEKAKIKSVTAGVSKK